MESWVASWRNVLVRAQDQRMNRTKDVKGYVEVLNERRARRRKRRRRNPMEGKGMRFVRRGTRNTRITAKNAKCTVTYWRKWKWDLGSMKHIGAECEKEENMPKAKGEKGYKEVAGRGARKVLLSYSLEYNTFLAQLSSSSRSFYFVFNFSSQRVEVSGQSRIDV